MTANASEIARWWAAIQELVRMGAPLEPAAGQGMTVWRAVQNGLEGQLVEQTRAYYRG